MRTKRTIINLVYSLGSSLVLLLLGLVTRKLFVTNFDVFIPGYSDTINNLFNFFSVAEFGVGSVISYRLYEQVAAKNNDKISKYMALYKWAYRAVGVVIALLSVVCAFFLPLLLHQDSATVDWATVYIIYLLQVVSTLASYFLVTRRLLYTCTQQGYVCTRIDLGFSILTSLCRIAIAQWLPNYILYFGVTIIFNTLANLVIARRYKRDFPAVQEVKVSVADFRALGLFRDLRYYLVHRISNAVYGSSDSLVITALLGAGQMTFVGNYTAISISVTNIGYKITDSFASAIGNIVYDKDAAADNHAQSVFWGMDLFSYAFGSFVAVAYFCLFQPFISLWGGENWLLPGSWVLAFCINEYIGWNHRMLGSYRAVLGRFEEDQWFMIASAVCNVVLSVVLIFPLGVTGVIVGTIVAHTLMWAGRVRVVCRYYMPGALRHYLAVQGAHIATLAAGMALTGWLCGFAPGGIIGLVVRAALVCVVPNALNLACYAWTPDAAYLRTYAAKLLNKLKK